MDFLISSAYAQAAGAAQTASPWSPLVMMLVFVAVFFFFVIRPQMKRAKDHRNMVAAIAKGDEVVTNGGILGRVDEIGDSFLAIEIADKVVIRVQKNAIAAVLPKGTLKAS
ncbi:MAG: preprotein translocase subunit YajC [Lysobacteraceae bacterium]